MIRVALTINNLNTAGMKYVLADIALRLDKSIFKPLIIVSKKSDSNLEKKLSDQFEIYELPLRNQGIGSFIPNLLKNRKTLKSICDIAHSFDYSSDWNEALTFKFAGIPLIAEKTNLSFSSKRWKIKLGLASHIICLSSAQAKQLNNYKNKLTTIPTGVDVSLYKNTNAVSRDSLGIKSNDIVLISVAHYVDVKGHREMIRAAGALKDKYPELKYIFVGTGSVDYLNELKKLAEEFKVSDKINFYGGSENVASLLKIADGKILATRNIGRREAFGAVIVEAMACSLPVIATKSGGPEDIIDDGVNGWLVEGEGYLPLVKGIETFLSNKSNWNAVGLNGFTKVLKEYRVEQMVEKYAQTYLNVYQNK